MFIKIVKKFDIKYDKLKKYLYNIRENIEVIKRFVPIKYNNMYLLMSPLSQLEGLFLEKNISKIEVSIIYNDTKETVKLKNITCIYDDDFNPNETYDCYFDVYQNLFFIRIFDSEQRPDLEFIELDNYNIIENYLLDYLISSFKIKINCSGINEYLDVKIDNEYVWRNKFVIFPEVPYLKIIQEQDIIVDGSEIYLIKENKDKVLAGVINFNKFDEEMKVYEYFGTPIFAIISSLKLISNKKYILFNADFETQPIKGLEREKITYCLTNDETLFNVYKTQDLNGNFVIVTTKILEKNTLLYQIDDYLINEDGNLCLSKPLSLKSYIWYFKELDIDNNYRIKFTKLRIIKSEPKMNIYFDDQEIKIYNNVEFSINLSNFNYINYKKKFLFELNESLLYLMKDFIFTDKSYKNFIDLIIKNKYKNKKMIIGLEFFPDDLELISEINNPDKNINYNNFEIKIIDDSIKVKPRIFLVKKYSTIQEIYNTFRDKKKMMMLVNSIFKNNKNKF